MEVAVNLPGVVAVRDSKDPHGPALTFTPADWHAFTTRLRSGDPGPAFTPLTSAARVAGHLKPKFFTLRPCITAAPTPCASATSRQATA